MATATIAGSTVTFSNSGAAANMTQTGGEDGSRAFTFDVLAASGGGKNTTLYSVDDGTSGDDNPAVAVNKAFAGYDTDLLYKDNAAASWQAGGDTSAAGAHVWIGADGKIHYDASNIDARIQSLAAGEHFIDTFEYTIKMANGTLSVGHLTVDIVGKNDVAVITGNDSANLTEGNNAAAISTGGKLDVTDVDHDQSNFQAQTGTAGNYGTFAVDAAGNWTYTANGAHNEFVGGQHYTEDFVVKSADGTEHTVHIDMLGTNDEATFAGVDSGTVLEATSTAGGTAHAAGQLLVSDVDSSANITGNTAASYGTFAIDAAGNWTYDLNNGNAAVNGLNASSPALHDVITVTTADGTTHDIDITINGADDATLHTGQVSFTVTKAGTGANTGSVAIPEFSTPGASGFVLTSAIVTGFGDYDRGGEGFTVAGDVTASVSKTGSGGDEPLNDLVAATNEAVVALGITDGDVDYSVTFGGNTLVGSTVTVEAHYSFFL